MLDEASVFILIWFGIPTCLTLFILFSPSKQKWILEARHVILFGPKERREKLVRMLKGKFKTKARKKRK